MATNKQIRTRTRWGVFGLLTMAALLVAAAAASGAELVTAEVDATPPANDVTVTQGTTTNFNIKLLAIGNISSLITRSNASTAAVKTEYSLSSSGSLTSSNFSGQ